MRPANAAPAFAAGLERFGDAPAIRIETGEVVSYRGLAERADAFAAGLDGVTLLFMEAANAVEPIAAYLGALRAGVPVLLSTAEADHAAIISTFRPDGLYRIDDSGRWSLERTSRHDGDPAPSPELAVLLSTSGTTGATKLVRLSGVNLQANAESIVEYLGVEPDDRAITSLPFHYSYGLSVLNSHLLVGASLVLTRRSVVDPEFWRAFDRHQVTSLAGVPHTYELLEKAGFRDRALPSLRTLTQAGGRLPPALVRAYAAWSRARGTRFFVMYGQTEATARMAYLPPEVAETHPDCIGRPIPRGAFRLVDSKGAPVDGPGAVGELVYSGPNVMLGYATNVGDLARGRELDELWTGDLACRTADGLYRIVGRKGRFAKIFGLRIGLDEVEAKLAEFGVSGVAVSDDEVVHIALTGAANAAVVRRRLATAYKLPEASFHVELWPALPTLSTGKVDYRRILKSSQQKAARRQATTTSDRLIEHAFARAFPHARIQPNDSFISLGGDSLNYVNLCLEIEAALGYLPQGWEHIELSELAALPSRVQARRPWSLRHTETELVIRAFAILGVVTTHASNLIVSGGADILMVLAGYNLSRYQAARLSGGRAWEVVAQFARRIILPYYALLAAYSLVTHRWDWRSFLLISNFHGRFGMAIEAYWFLEVLLQCLVIVALLAMIGPVRRAIAGDPWRFGLIALGAALALRVGASAVFRHDHLENRTPDAVLYLLALGWCFQQARTLRQRGFVTAVALIVAWLDVAGAPGLWSISPPPSNYSHALWLLACTAGILWIRRISLPSIAHQAVWCVAGASFYIYLTHMAPIWLFRWRYGIDNVPLSVCAATLVGIATWKAYEFLDSIHIENGRIHRPAAGRSQITS